MYHPNAYSCDDLVTFIIRRVYLLVLLQMRSVMLSNKRTSSSCSEHDDDDADASIMNRNS